MYWIYLGVAGVFEVVWATAMGYSHGFTKLTPSIVTLAGMAVSVFCLSQALKGLPLGTAYAVWTGIGAIGTVVAGVVLFHEPAGFLRFFFVGLILAGIIGLKLVTPH